ncbi:MAG: porin [Candidatus Tokpelaia sp. JSC161]|jgi:hypothetical protein|nr:MAG: porin [Candidatus Tokpelaia sp. JSC161]
MNRKNLISFALFFLMLSEASAFDFFGKEPVVRDCKAYGPGYFYIPGTEICMHIFGEVSSELRGGGPVEAKQYEDLNHKNRHTLGWITDAKIGSSTAMETDFGTLRTVLELESNWTGGAELGNAGSDSDMKGELKAGYIQLGGLQFGLDASAFQTWTNGFGNFAYDDLLTPLSSMRTNALTYVFSVKNGFSALLSLAQGANYQASSHGFRFNDQGKEIERELRQQIDSYIPYIVVGAKYGQDWGGFSSVAAYDSYYSEWAGKVRLDGKINDQVALWVMAGYKSMDDYYAEDKSYGHRELHPGFDRTGIYRQFNSIYGDWGGHWALWAGSQYVFTPKSTLDFQISLEEAKTFVTSASLSHKLSPSLELSSGLSYISWGNNYGYTYEDHDVINSLYGKDAVRGMIKLIHSF